MDNCEICKGTNGGVKGNENIVDNIVMCDYCTVQYERTLEQLNSIGKINVESNFWSTMIRKLLNLRDKPLTN